MLKHLSFYAFFLLFCGQVSGQKALWGVDLGIVATKPNATGLQQYYETGLGPSLNLNYTWKFKKALWVSAGLTAKSLTYNGVLKLIFPSDIINNTGGTIYDRQTRHFTAGTTVLAGVELPGIFHRFSPFIGLGGSFILRSSSRTTRRSGSENISNLSYGDYNGTITELTGGLQYSHPIGKRFFLTTSVRYVYAPADVVDSSAVFPNPTYNLSHFAACISLQRAIRL